MHCPPFSSVQLELAPGLSSPGPLDAVFVVPFSLHEDVSVDLSLLPMTEKRTMQQSGKVPCSIHGFLFDLS